MTGPIVTAFDHIVLCVNDLPRTIAFYTDVLGMTCREERPGKWALYFGANKISLQDAAAPPALAKGTVPGSGNFCMLSATPVAVWRDHLVAAGVEIIADGIREGATGDIDSLYFRDPDGNLVEVSNLITAT